MMNEWIISSSLLIAAVLLGRFLLRGKISLRLQYGLWLLVLVRLLLPIQVFTSDFGAGSIARQVDISQPVRQVYVSPDRYEREYDEAYRQVVAEYEASHWHADPMAIEKTAQAIAESNLELDLKAMLLHIWFAGMVVMTAVIVSCNVHLGLQLKHRRWDLHVADSLLPVYVTGVVPTPCVFGVFRPAIYLTPETTRDDQVRAHVLEHELTHYRHLDHIWSVLRSVCLALHWYNPLVWMAAKVSRADAELACDEGALARLGESQRGDYGRTLIGLTCSAPISELLLTATTMTGSAGSIRERIKLLMKRPRNTVLTVTAVILMVMLIVGCTFSAAPETTHPTETAPSGVDNDMSYQETELPIPDNPAQTDLTYALPMAQAMAEYTDKNPRFLNGEELYQFNTAFAIVLEDGTQNPAPCFLYPYYNEIYEMDGGQFLAYFPHSADADEREFELLKAKYPEVYGTWTWDELPVPIHRYEAADIEAVVSRWGNIHWQELSEGVHYLEETDCYYNYTSDFSLGGFHAREGFVYDGGAVVYSDDSALFLTETAENYTIRAHLPLLEEPPADQTEEVRALFAEGADPWYLAALAAPYADWQSFDAISFFSAGQTAVALTEEEKALITEVYGKDAVNKTVFRMTEEQMDRVLDQYAGTMVWNVDLSAFVYCHETNAYLLVREEVPQLRIPEIISCQQLAENQVRMIYRFPGEEQTYCATLLKGENWKVYSNHLLIDKPLNARPLTELEVTQVRDKFRPDFYDEEQNMAIGNPLAAFFLDMYGDISEMSRSEFLSYYPATEDAGEEEFQLLKQKYPEEFENEETIRDMNWPIHRVPVQELEAFMEKYTLIEWDDLPQDGSIHYLEETDCYYTYYSDAGLFGFHCTGGWVYDGGAMLYNNFNTPMSVLVLTEQNGKYYIQAHLPALIAE